MALGAIIGNIIGAVLGRKKDEDKTFKMGSIGESVQPNTVRRYDEGSGQYLNSRPNPRTDMYGGGVNDQQGDVQPGQLRELSQNGGGYTDAGQQQGGGGFQNAMGTVNTIGGFIGNLQGNRNRRGPYQMQMRR